MQVANIARDMSTMTRIAFILDQIVVIIKLVSINILSLFLVTSYNIINWYIYDAFTNKDFINLFHYILILIGLSYYFDSSVDIPTHFFKLLKTRALH